MAVYLRLLLAHPMSRLHWRSWNSLDFWITLLGAVLVTAAAFWVAVRYIQPAPPKKIVMTAGPEGGAYESFAQELKLFLAQNGVELELRTTSGAQEDLRLLNDEESGVTLAVVQGGVAQEDQETNLMSLAALYHEPVWLFYSSGVKVFDLAALKGRRIGIGPDGSGVQALATQLLKANGIDGSNSKLLDVSSREAASKLQQKQLDAMFIVGAPESNLVGELMRAPSIQLLSFNQAEAYTRQFPFLAHIVLPRGVFDLGRHFPANDVDLIAPTANLVVRDDIHPALINLLMDAATDITGDAGMLRKEGQFPSPKGVDIPLSDDAERYMKSGPSFLHQHLPFWLAVWIDRLVVLLIPIFAVVLPLMRFAPGMYAWRIKSRIYRWYGKLKALEYDLDLASDQVDRDEALRRLDAIDVGVARLRTPLAFSEHLYNLRAHVELVRRRLLASDSSVTTSSPFSTGDSAAEAAN